MRFINNKYELVIEKTFDLSYNIYYNTYKLYDYEYYSQDENKFKEYVPLISDTNFDNIVKYIETQKEKRQQTNVL